MFYWNEEMDQFEATIGAISAAGRLKLAVDAITWTLENMSLPIEDGSAQSFISAGLELARRAMRQGIVYPAMSPEYEAEFDRLLEDVTEDGVGSLVMAVGTLFSAGDDVMHPQVAFNILWSCYEAVLLREFDVPTPELEADSGRCLAVIDYQKALIEQAR
ncbi:hypothetical protein L0U85_09585 [Glycomyces sp. L485]|uniref:hypothetical protein n=1 Tax=Glycomyces sp. L485 TaxID=2909235 RepID=UPI001F4A285F|nr:hypothetical protein [Glycomyces sp. L485]MCH7231102.1 hypothetical protein [Glycomyces sp. L485]